MPTRHQTGRSARPTPGRGLRLGFLLGAATLGAVGVAVIAPHASAATSITADAGARNAAASVLSPEQAASRGTMRAPIAGQDTTQGLPAAQAAHALARTRVRELNDPHTHPRGAPAATSTHSSSSDATTTPPPHAGQAGQGAYRAYARSKVGAAQFSCLDALWTKESGWRATARNPYSTAYGIPQLLDTTWAATGIAMTSNGYRQVDAGLAYITAAYGTPCSAWAHSRATNWY